VTPEPTLMDVMEWPATPQQMHAQLALEAVAMAQGNFNEHGIEGYLFLPDVRAYEVPPSMRWAMRLGPDGEVVMRITDERFPEFKRQI
jgi:hypothetical protein